MAPRPERSTDVVELGGEHRRGVGNGAPREGDGADVGRGRADRRDGVGATSVSTDCEQRGAASKAGPRTYPRAVAASRGDARTAALRVPRGASRWLPIHSVL